MRRAAVTGEGVASAPSATRPERSVLHVHWHMDVGGTERSVYLLVREQRRRGIEADVMVGSYAGFYGGLAAEAGARVHELRQRNALDLAGAARAVPVFRGYEVVHFHYPGIGLMHVSARRSDARLYYTHRAGIFRYGPKQLLRYKLAGRYLKRCFAGISANTAQSALAASRLFGLPAPSIPVTYNGIDFGLLAPQRSWPAVAAEVGGEPGTIYVGTAANLRAWKRVDRLLRAVAALGESRVRCVVVGDGPARGELERLARQLGISDAVAFTGRTEHVGDYLQLLDVFVLPSGPEEAFGNAIVEAMGVGLPVVVFGDGGGLLEHVEDGRSGIVVRDESELVARLADLVRDGDLRNLLGEAAREFVTSRYGLAAMADRYDALYALSRDERVAAYA